MKNFTLLGLLSLVLALSLPGTVSAASRSKWTLQDLQWLQENPELRTVYHLNPSLFYYTLPSRTGAFSLHPYSRDTFYQTYHRNPPTPAVVARNQAELDAQYCANYSYSRPNYRVPPFAYKCLNQ